MASRYARMGDLTALDVRLFTTMSDAEPLARRASLESSQSQHERSAFSLGTCPTNGRGPRSKDAKEYDVVLQWQVVWSRTAARYLVTRKL
jgi:hypothetical protein